MPDPAHPGAQFTVAFDETLNTAVDKPNRLTGWFCATVTPRRIRVTRHTQASLGVPPGGRLTMRHCQQLELLNHLGGRKVKVTISPRFSEVDVLGHVTNSAVPIWFEHGRMPIFRLFSKEPNMRDLALILRRYEIDFTRQIFASVDVTIETKVTKVGNTSIAIEQIATQDGAEVARGTCIMVHFDYEREATTSIPDHLRAELSAL